MIMLDGRTRAISRVELQSALDTMPANETVLGFQQGSIIDWEDAQPIRITKDYTKIRADKSIIFLGPVNGDTRMFNVPGVIVAYIAIPGEMPAGTTNIAATLGDPSFLGMLIFMYDPATNRNFCTTIDGITGNQYHLADPTTEYFGPNMPAFVMRPVIGVELDDLYLSGDRCQGLVYGVELNGIINCKVKVRADGFKNAPAIYYQAGRGNWLDSKTDNCGNLNYAGIAIDGQTQFISEHGVANGGGFGFNLGHVHYFSVRDQIVNSPTGRALACGYPNNYGGGPASVGELIGCKVEGSLKGETGISFRGGSNRITVTDCGAKYCDAAGWWAGGQGEWGITTKGGVYRYNNVSFPGLPLDIWQNNVGNLGFRFEGVDYGVKLDAATGSVNI